MLTIDFGSQQRVDKTFIRLLTLLLDMGGDISFQLLKALHDLSHTIRIMLEITEHLCNVEHPGIQPPMILDWHAQQLCRHQWLAGERRILRSGPFRPQP